MPQFINLQIIINDEQSFFLHENIISAFSGRLKKIIRKQKRKPQIEDSIIELNDFPGGPDGFEQVSRFCYNHGRVEITVSNVSLLYCCAFFLGMTEKASTNNLLKQTEKFFEGMFYWSWNDIIMSLRSCEPFFSYADSYGLIQKLIFALLAKFAQNSDMNFIASSSSSSSPETSFGFRFSSTSKASPDPASPCTKSGKDWWFDELTNLSPKIIEKIIRNLGAYGNQNNSFTLTRFLLHYLKSRPQGSSPSSKSEYSGLADTAVHGVILVGKTKFSCRKLFWVLRLVSGFNLSKDYRAGLERLIGENLDEATVDDLLVSGHNRGVYDVNLVIRLIRVFVSGEEVDSQKMKKLGRLIDKYLREISPDQNLNISKFLAVAESLPDSARDCFDGVYRAIDFYLQSHPTLSFEERSKLCRCLNYEKLSFEASKELAKNPRIPPNVSVQALISQQSKVPQNGFLYQITPNGSHGKNSHGHMVLFNYNSMDSSSSESFSEGTEDMKLNLQKMQWRVVELEKACKEMKGQMSKLVRNNTGISTPFYNVTLPRFC
ncbi:BTB/POZ domain-containing protein [Hibiscus syriacus]|uniref:BTB/POZ domain-containing protein n=1 Tax=Hibiscus syriacus TaxID=106335 RepID=A0A6A3B092_HIBSY|nr:BTB/POZ domain-containing protein At3g19850-like [Hibiscus syriacus]KAE8710101.1 BTB/POZ domain-containing protein [Hibiscus syriacus]